MSPESLSAALSKKNVPAPLSMDAVTLKIRKLQCAHVLMDAYARCMKVLYFCIKMGKQYAPGDHIRLLENCAFFCATTADHVLREPRVLGKTYEECARLCDSSAAACESPAFSQDARMKECASFCRDAAKACRETAPLEEKTQTPPNGKMTL